MKRSWAFFAALVFWASAARALPLGSACTLPSQCDSGFCVEGVCCGSACSESCATCLLAKGAPADGTCGPVSQGTLATCFPYPCDGSGTSCPTSCGTAGCVTGYVCNAATLKCVGSNGQPCVTPGDCLSGFCEDGFCCGSACGGCYACAQALTGTQSGVCAGVTPDTDPHDFCAQDPGYPGSCLADGVCNIEGKCNAFATSGTICEPSECVGTKVVQHLCDGAGACLTEDTECAPGTCSQDFCNFACDSDDDCSPTNGYCDPTGICAPKGLDGSSCGQDKACLSGVCANAICCKTACKKGPRCEAGVAYTADHCDGAGNCVPGTPTPCGAYACDLTACRQSCSGKQDCVAGADCIEQKCVAQATCDGDHTLTNPKGELTDCSPFRCTSAGICHASCTSSLQCVAGYTCNSSERCVRVEEASDSSNCGCRLAPDRRSGWELLLLVSISLAWRRARKF